MNMKPYLLELLIEASRRFLIRKENKIDTYFAGLGYPRTYALGVEQGYFICTSEPTPRILGWYKLTPKGQVLVNQLVSKLNSEDFDDFNLRYDSYAKIKDVVKMFDDKELVPAT